MNLGKTEADSARLDVLERVGAHEGAMIVIDGMLSDEIPESDNRIIMAAITRAAEKGLPAMRLWGCDGGEKPFLGWEGIGHTKLVFESQQDAAAAIAEQCAKHPVFVTGAWASYDSDEGCVNSVVDVLREMLGADAQVRIDETAICVPDGNPDNDLPGYA